MKLFRNILLFFILLSASELMAQELVHKVSKEYSKNFDQDIEQVLVRGEKASISVTG